MALRYIDPIRSEDPERFDLYGLVLAGIGLGGIAFGLSIAGLNLLPWTIVIALVAIGTISMTLYVIHARRTASPVLDFALLRLPTMRASIIGGFLFRLGIGSLPFLLPLLMQVGFGLSPLRSGLVTFASAVGAMGMKTLAARIIKTFGFRNIMVINAIVSSVFLAACALFTIATPLLLIMILLVVGGFFRSLQFTAINTLAYAEVEPAQMSRATTLVSVNQQLAVSAGVAVGAFSVESTMLLHHVSELSCSRFRSGIHRGVDHLGDFGVLLLRDAGRCRSSGLGTRSCGRYPVRNATPNRRRPLRPRPLTPGISGWGRSQGGCSANPSADVWLARTICSSPRRRRSCTAPAKLCCSRALGEFDAANGASGWNTWLTFAISPAAPAAVTPTRHLVTK